MKSVDKKLEKGLKRGDLKKARSSPHGHLSRYFEHFSCRRSLPFTNSQRDRFYDPSKKSQSTCFLHAGMKWILQDQAASLRKLALLMDHELLIKISRKSLHLRMNAACLRFCKSVMDHLYSFQSIHQKFKLISLGGIEHVLLVDSTLIKTPDQLKAVWPGTQSNPSSLKLQFALDLLRGTLSHLGFTSGNCPDQGYSGYLSCIKQKMLLIWVIFL